MTTLGERLNQLRTKSKKTLKEIGDAVGLSAVYISDLEKGKKKNPSSEVLRDLANYFDVSTDYLLGREEKDITNPDIRAIARAGEKMSTKDAADLKNLAERLFPDAFKNKEKS